MREHIHQLARHLRRTEDEPSTTLALAAATSAAGAPPSNPTIEPFTTALNGVNQTRNEQLQTALMWSFGAVALLVLAFRIWDLVHAHARHMYAMAKPKDEQTYFTRNRSPWWPYLKRQVLLAPLGKKRHNREIRLSSAVNIGTLPSRLHAFVLIMYLLSNVIYCLVLKYEHKNRWETMAELRGRSGVLAVANMVPLVLLAGRNNPLISILQISFDTYNLLHRWVGRMIVLEVIVHTTAWFVTEMASAGWAGVSFKIKTDPFVSYGFVATTAMVLIFLTSPSAIRHAFYETFLNAHILFVILTFIGVWVHCDLGELPQLPYIQAAVCLWILDRTFRFVRIVWYNYSRQAGWTSAVVEMLPGEACRVTMHLPTYVQVSPGSHAYLRFSSISPWESHPFSIGWTKHHATSEVLPSTEKPLASVLDPSQARTDVSFVIHAQTGMTRRIYDKCVAAHPQSLHLKAAFEGPYGGHHSLSSYGTAVLFAGSSGITHQIPYIHQLIKDFSEGTIATQRIVLVWIVRDLDHLEWVRPWMDEILRLRGRREILNIKLFITRPKSAKELVSPSATVQMFPGRPNVRQIISTEVSNQTGAMCVTVCGPGGLADNVRGVVREVQHAGVVDFIEESFTW